MSAGTTFGRIILPQALRRMLPATVNQFIATVKDSSLAAAIGLAELTRRATELQTQTYRPLELYTVLAVEYLALLLALTRIAQFVERRVKPE
jgi:polar amino acid transport system permease protein